MKKKKRRHSIKFKIILILILGFILPFFFQIFWVSGLMNNIVQDKIFAMTKRNVENTALRIQDNIQSQFDMTWFYREERAITNAIERMEIAEDKELKSLQAEVTAKLVTQNNIERYSYPFHYYLLDHHGNMMTNYSYTPNAGYPDIYKKIAETEWFQQLAKSYTEKTVIFAEQDFLNISGPKKLYIATNVIGKEENGVFMIAVDASSFTKQMEAIFPTGTGYLLGKNGNCLLTSDKKGNVLSEEFIQVMEKHEEEFQNNQAAIDVLDGKRYLFMEQKVIIKGYDPQWKLLLTVPLKDITGEITGIYLINILVLGLYLAAIIFVIIMLNRNIVKPIRILRESVNEVTKGNLEVVISGMPDNELGELGEGFNGMVRNLDDYIMDIRKNEMLQREVEVRLLQNQIKPHFVRNVLNTIRWLAEINGVKSVGDSIMALSNLLEYNFRDSKMFTTVNDEITYVKGYLYLQKLRFQNKFKDIYEVDEKILNYAILKLSFQPIVENCIYHGILNKDGLGIIKIHGYLDGENMIFEISDNGRGIREEKIQDLLEPPTSDDIVEKTKGTDSIALWNINQRIQRQFGEAYGIEIRSEENNGTMVILKFPVSEEREL